jgi:hypothetical protein
MIELRNVLPTSVVYNFYNSQCFRVVMMMEIEDTINEISSMKTTTAASETMLNDLIGISLVDYESLLMMTVSSGICN